MPGCDTSKKDCKDCIDDGHSCTDCKRGGFCDEGRGRRRRGAFGYGAIDPNLIVSTIGQAVGDIAGRYRHPSTAYIAPPSACSFLERADSAGICKPNYAMLFVILAATVAVVGVGSRRGR